MPKFRKKPVVIEAFRWTNGCERPEWARFPAVYDNGECLEIHTPEGVMVAQPGDWIIRGVAGEVYPCKPEIFEVTYEPAEAG